MLERVIGTYSLPDVLPLAQSQPVDVVTASSPSTFLYSGLQYTDSAYVSLVLLTLTPLAVVSLFAAFAGNAKHVKFLFTAIYGTAACFFYTLTWICNLDIDATVGIPLSVMVLLLAAWANAFYTESAGWALNVFWCLLIATATVLQLLANATPFGLGVLVVFPGYLTAPTPTQFTWQMAFLTGLAISSFIAMRTLYAWRFDVNNVAENARSAFVSAYFVIAGCSYLFLLTGLSPRSGFDPVGIFASPTPISLKLVSQVTLLSIWILLFGAGWLFQVKRDKQLIRYVSAEKRSILIVEESSSKEFSDDESKPISEI